MTQTTDNFCACNNQTNHSEQVHNVIVHREREQLPAHGQVSDMPTPLEMQWFLPRWAHLSNTKRHAPCTVSGMFKGMHLHPRWIVRLGLSQAVLKKTVSTPSLWDLTSYAPTHHNLWLQNYSLHKCINKNKLTTSSWWKQDLIAVRQM